MAECETIRYLRGIAASGDKGFARAAQAALDIIVDIEEDAMTGVDIDCLHSLVDAIYKDGHASLLAHLREGAADCRICAALAARMDALEHRAAPGQ